MRKRWDINSVSKRFKDIYEDNATLLSKTYKSTKDKLHAYCNIHHVDVYQSWYNLNRGKLGCKKCRYQKVSNTLSHNNDWYREKLQGHNIINLDDYVKKDIKINHKCLKCNNTFLASPVSVLKSFNCPYCGVLTLFTKDCIQYHINNSLGTDYVLQDNAKSVADYVTLLHTKCGNTYKVKLNNALSGSGCPTCNGNLKKTTKQYIQECKETGQDLPIEDYKNNKIRIKHKCSKGHIYEQTPDMHIGKYKQGCPICNESHGERFIRNYLDKNHIEYIPQKKFNDLKDKTYLSYDFYLPDYNMLIEYQGIQHYESINIKGSGKYSNLKKQQYHDNLKREYAKNNGYKLLELKYTLNTQELVDRYLSRRIKD